MRTKIVALGDIHYGPGTSGFPERWTTIAKVLLRKAVYRVNHLIKPDVVLILGDLIEDAGISNPEKHLEELAKIIDMFQCPVITIPGNHDVDIDDFFRTIQRPPEIVDIEGVRILPFIDPEAPMFCAKRLEHDIARVAKARHNFTGPMISAQHVPLFPPDTAECHYNYTNADEIIADFKTHGVSLAISGHYHLGMDLYFHKGVAYAAVPALCESPFAFLEILINEDSVTARKHQLKIPGELELVDSHVHTQFAYCAEDVEIVKALTLADELGLAGMGFAEHADQLYVSREEEKEGRYYFTGLNGISDDSRRIEQYFETVSEYCPPESIGLEVDADFSGRPIIEEQHLSRAGYTFGSIHRLKELYNPGPDIDKLYDEYLTTLSMFLKSKITALAHPFRIFRQFGLPTPVQLFRPTIKMLVENHVAAELNFHHNEPPEEFFRMCLSSGVRLTLGSDSHALWQVGEFARHLQFLENIGFNGDLNDILLDPRGKP